MWVFRIFHTQSFRENRQHETNTQERNKMGFDDDPKTDFNKRKQELTKLPCLAHYNGTKKTLSLPTLARPDWE